jgi:hypothetical protein
MQILTIAGRLLWCVASATAYQIATNPFVLAVGMAIAGFWPVAAVLLLAYTAGCIGAVVTARDHASPLTGELIRSPPKGALFWLFGDDQLGLFVPWHRAKYPKAMQWIAPFVWTFWRNKVRNLPFVPALKWLHQPKGELRVIEWAWGKVKFRIRTRGWMTEFEYFTASRFGDIGPRLDQPGGWGAVSWAFRIAGRL